MDKVEVHKSEFTADEFEMAIRATGGYIEGYNKALDDVETIIDESGTLEESESTATEKVEQLIDLAKRLEAESIKALFLRTLTEFTIMEEFDWGGLRLSNCYNLAKVVTPNRIGGVGGYEFYGCGRLEYVDFGKVTGIDSSGIGGIHRLTTIIFRNTEQVVTLSQAFYNCNSITQENYTYYCHFYVPKALLEDYKVATNWSNYANRFRAIEDYPEITGGVI